MTSKQVSIYRCDFCGRSGRVKAKIGAHERYCFKNPDRTPYEGELSRVRDEGKMVNFGYDESIKTNWLEWVPHETMPRWWPGKSGMIYHDGKWHDVPGYSRRPATGAHGCAGGSEDVEEWPMLDGAWLPDVATTMRYLILAAQKERGQE